MPLSRGPDTTIVVQHKNDAGDHVRKNTKSISFSTVRRCSFEHYTCHRNLENYEKIELHCDYRLLIGKKFHLDE